jgi:hypothetical protein
LQPVRGSRVAVGSVPVAGLEPATCCLSIEGFRVRVTDIMERVSIFGRLLLIGLLDA